MLFRRTVAFVPNRHHLPDLLAARELFGTGVEVGVQHGIYSEIILERSALGRLILVDPWQAYASDDYRDASNVAQDQQDRGFEEVRKRTSRFGDRAVIWRMTSVDAAAQVCDASLDFVYLDARHDYEHVKEDLGVWWPKLKSGGIMAGHDYLNGQVPQGLFGVRSAVDEFFAAKGIAVRDTYEDRPWSSWVVAPADPSRGRGVQQAISAARAGLTLTFRIRRKLVAERSRLRLGASR